MNAFAPWIYDSLKPDTFSLKHFVESDCFKGKQGEDFAVAVFEYLCDPETGIFHYCPVEDRFRNREVHDPLVILNAFGFCICHIHAHITVQIFKAAGYTARVACITGHEGAEIFYDGLWHYYDTDLRGYSRRHPPEQNIVASREDCYKDPTIVSQQQNPSKPVYYVTDRPAERMAELFKSEPHYLKPVDELTHSMDFVLRPGETIVRNVANEGKYIMTGNYRRMWEMYWIEPGPGGPKDRWNTKRNWANGHWIYEPNLRSESADIDYGARDISGFIQTDDGLEVVPGETGLITIPFDLPYPICGIPDETGIYPSRNGALFTFDTVRARRSDKINVSLSFDEGKTWDKVWFSASHDRSVQTIDLTRFLDNRYRFLLKIDIIAGKRAASETLRTFDSVSLASDKPALLGFKADISFMHSPWAMPLLDAGKTNIMNYHAMDKNGRPTRKFELQVVTSDSDALNAALYDSDNLDYDPNDFSITKPKKPTKDYSLVFKLDAPEDGVISWIYAYALLEGHLPDETKITTMKIDVRDGSDGDWKNIDEKETEAHALRWHILHGTEARFSEKNRAVYLRFRAKKGIAAVRVCAHYIPDDARKKYENPPVEITHRYLQGGRALQHMERIPAGVISYEYSVNTPPIVENLGYDIRVPSMKRDIE